MDLEILQPARPSVMLAMKHFDSDDFFQQLLSADSALQALRTPETELRLQYQTLKNNGHAAESEAIQQLRTDLAALVRKVEDIQTAARNSFNLRARPLLRNLSILHLPDEMLLHIFDDFKDDLGSDDLFYDTSKKADVKSIQNVRLTCRRLCNISSHLLVPRLEVSPSIASLERLEQVTRHPEISQCGRLLKIDMSIYAATLAEDFQLFSLECHKKAQNRAEDLVRLLRIPESSWHDMTHGSRETVTDTLAKATRRLSSWEPFMDGSPTDVGQHLDPDALALQKGHERYRELYHQQEKILQGGHFARTVAAAARRSNSNVWLYMSDTGTMTYHDSFRDQWARVSNTSADPDLLVQSDLIPMQGWGKEWGDEGDEAEESIQSLLYELPLAMHSAGVPLAGIQVSIDPPYRLALDMSQDQLSDLREVFESLRFFKFHMDRTDNREYWPTPEELKPLFSYLSAASGPQSVPMLSLRLPIINPINAEGAQSGIKTFLSCSNWQRLEVISLAHFSIGLHELKEFVGMLQSKTRLEFEDVHLASGSWEEALECLRSKASWGSQLIDPLGAECEDMDYNEYKDIFLGIRQGSKATQFITSVEGVENPLLMLDE